jgi:phenylpyruvate tautomerase PptA (4-oxalocrotonate tautomerase family)
MPYLKLTSPDLLVEAKRALAGELTDAVLRALRLPDEHRQRGTVHFTPFRPEDQAIGGRLVADGREPDSHLAITDRGLTPERKGSTSSSRSPTRRTSPSGAGPSARWAGVKAGRRAAGLLGGGIARRGRPPGLSRGSRPRRSTRPRGGA